MFSSNRLIKKKQYNLCCTLQGMSKKVPVRLMIPPVAYPEFWGGDQFQQGVSEVKLPEAPRIKYSEINYC